MPKVAPVISIIADRLHFGVGCDREGRITCCPFPTCETLMKLSIPLMQPALLLLLLALTACMDPEAGRRAALKAGPAFEAGDWPTVQVHMEKAIEANRAHPGHWMLLGRAKYEQGDIVGAKDALARSRELWAYGPRVVQGHTAFWRAKIALQEGRFEDAKSRAEYAEKEFRYHADGKNTFQALALLAEIESKMKPSE
mgnify:CR=1 FL=1